MSFLSRSLASLAALGYHNSRWHLGVGLAVVAATPFLLYGLEVDADAAKLIPDSDPIGAAYRDSRTVFGESNPLILELRHDGVAPDELDAFTDRLAAILDGWDDIGYVTARPLDLIDRSDMAWRLRAALMNAGPEELEAFRSKLSEVGMRRQLLRTRKRLVALDDPWLRALLARDPLDIRSHLAGLERQRVRDWDRLGDSVYFDSVDGRSRLLYAQPLGSAEDSTYCRLLLERIGGAVGEARRRLSTTSGIETRVTGVHALTAQSTDVLLADLALLTGVATAALFALLWLAFGRLRATLLCFLPLLGAQLAVLSLARLAFNPIHPLTIGFAAVVVGLGLDIGLHMTGRLAQFLDELPLEDAIRSTFADAGPPVVVGAVSTTLAFLALLVTGNRGLVQFGVLAALGLVVTLIATLLLFPALARHLVGSASSGRDLELRGAPTPLLRFVTRRPGASMAIGLLLAVVALPYAARFRFETDVAGLFPSGLEATEVASEIATAHAVSPGATSLVTIRAVDLSSAMALQREVDRHLIALVEQGAVSAFESPSRYLVDPASHRPDGDWRSTGERVVAARSTFFALLEELRFRIEPTHDAYYDILEEATTAVPSEASLPGALGEVSQLERYVDTSPAGLRLQTYVMTSGTADTPFGFDAPTTRRVTRELRELPPSAGASLSVSGLVQVYERAQELLVADFRRISWIALLLVTAVSLLFFRRPAPTLLTFVPLAAAVPLTLAAMVWLGLSVEPFAISFGAIVVGVGIDDAVHIVARVTGRASEEIPKVVREIGTVITLTTVSTVLGFGALTLSRLPVVSSLGGVVAVGVTACWLFTLLLLPAATRWMRRDPTGRLIAGGCLLLSVGVTDAFAQTKSADEILVGMERTFESVEALSCDIEQVKSVEQLSEPIELSGTLLMQKPHFVRLELSGDETLSLFCDGETVWLVDYDLEEVEAFPLGQRQWRDRALARLLPSLLFLGREELEERFEVTWQVPQLGRYRLEFRPKTTRDASFSRLLVDLGRGFRMRRLRTEFANSDSVTTRLENCRRSKRLPTRVFRYDGP